MKDLLIAMLWCAFTITTNSCATIPRNPDGTEAPLPEQMQEGRQVCLSMCAKVNREYQEYRYDGKCVCKPATRLIPLDPNRQM